MWTFLKSFKGLQNPKEAVSGLGMPHPSYWTAPSPALAVANLGLRLGLLRHLKTHCGWWPSAYCLVTLAIWHKVGHMMKQNLTWSRAHSKRPWKQYTWWLAFDWARASRRAAFKDNTLWTGTRALLKLILLCRASTSQTSHHNKSTWHANSNEDSNITRRHIQHIQESD